MHKRRKSDLVQILPGMILVLVLIGIIFGSGVASTKTTESQAAEYLHQSSHRAAEELEKTFLRQDENILTMAHMTAHIMDYERIDTEKLVHLTENSSFDGIEYIHPTGGCYGMNEQGWDVADKEYFKDAVQKNVGYAYDDAPERGEEGCILFYAPILSDQDEFYGILVGYLRKDTLENMLDVSFWGHSAKQYLCTMDGTIIASNTQKECGIGIIDAYKKCGCMTDDERDDLAELLQTGNGTFQYQLDGKTELGSVSSVADSKFLIVETFPPEVLSEFVAPVMNKMHLAVAAVVISIAVYGLIMFLISRNSKRALEVENEKVNKLLKGAEGLANHDELTGLFNRRGMLECVSRRGLEHKQRACLLLDVDRFKQINDTHGHKVGDQVLVKLARLLRETFREEDVIARMGGDEFAVILPNLKRNQAGTIKKKIACLNEKLQNPDDSLPAFSLSVGAAFSQPNEKDELFVRADKALYKMKEKGRCGCCVYEEEFSGILR